MKPAGTHKPTLPYDLENAQIHHDQGLSLYYQNCHKVPTNKVPTNRSTIQIYPGHGSLMGLLHTAKQTTVAGKGSA